ncbi:MAG: CDP-alcohol phosphatidyltransferase family protein [Treponema sp.]|nr:CDP-alcohol phosphatidyltransferase family protein [Treponema sp.]
MIENKYRIAKGVWHTRGAGNKTTIIYKSLLWPRFEQYVSDPIFAILPWWIPANFITLSGNFCLFLATAAAYVNYRTGLVLWPLIPFLVCAYLIGDLLDGKQARRTNTCAPLGEFFDHFFDILVMGCMVSMVLFAYRINDPLTVGLIITVGYLPLFGSFYEQYFCETLYFEAISSFEMIFAGTVVCCLGFIDPFRAVIYAEFLPRVSVLSLALGLSAVVGLTLFARNILRTGKQGKPVYLLFLLPAAAVFFFASALVERGFLFVMIIYCAAYVERFLLAYVRHGKPPLPDIVFPLILAAFYFLRLPHAAPFAVVYQGLVILALFLRGFVPLRDGWRWRNPPEHVQG